MRNPFDPARRSLRPALMLLVLAGLAPAACERDMASKKAIEEASVQLDTLDTGFGNAATSDRRDKVYNTIVTSLKDASGSSVPAYASSANILLAKAHTGLAESPASDVAALEAEAYNRIRIIRADLSQWIEMNAIAVAADGYDPAPEVTALEAQVSQIQDAVAGLTKASADVSGRRETLVNEASGLLSQSKTLRDEIGALRIKSTSVNATEGAAISEQIRERSRAADALEMKASEINSRADVLVPQVAEIELNIAGLNNQIESLRAAQAAAQQRGSDAKTEATAARALATQASAQLDKEVEQLIQTRDGDLTRAYEDAQRLLSAAAGAARKAATDNRSGSKLAEGVALQQSGDLSWLLAQGLAEHHALLSALASAEPDLPRSGAYEGAAAAAETARGEALTKAAEAYEQAKSALTAAGARGEAGERLEKVGRMLDLIIQATQGQTVDWSAANKPAPAESDEAPATDDGAVPTADSGELASTIQGWVDQLKTGDASFVPDIIHSDVPSISNAMGSIGSILSSMTRLDAACKDKFGQTLTEFGKSQAQGQGVPGMGQLPSIDDFSVDDLDIKVDGDSATMRPISAPDGQPIKFVRVDGAWKIDLTRANLPPEFAGIEPMIDQIVGVLPRVEAAVQEVIDQTESGGYVSLQAVTIDLQQKIMPIAMEVMNSIQPPPGGGG